MNERRTAVVRPRDRGALECRGTVIVTPAAVERIPSRHAVAARRVDAARLDRHTRYLHNRQLRASTTLRTT